MARDTCRPNRHTRAADPAEAGISKDRIFESTLVIPVRRRPKAKRKSTNRQKATQKAARQPRKRRDHRRSQNAERKEQRSLWNKLQRRKARESGLCRHCGEPASPSQTRCETCAEKNRVYRRKWEAGKKEKQESTVTKVAPPLDPSLLGDSGGDTRLFSMVRACPAGSPAPRTPSLGSGQERTMWIRAHSGLSD